MKIVKRILISSLLLLVLGVVFLLAAPILFKDKIVENVKSGVNSALEAEVDFRDVNLSFLRSFPEVSLLVDDVEIVGVDTFAGLPLMTAKEVRVDVGFWSVVGGDGNYNIDAVALDEPVVNLLVLTPELANYLIVPEGEEAPEDPATAPATAQINLSHYEINNGTLVYDDRTTETYLRIEGLTTTGDGDFTAAVFDLDTDSEADAITLRQSGITYLKKAKAVADAMVNVDLTNSRYTFLDNKITINALDLVFSGSIDLEDNDDIVFDLDYQAPANNFRQLWSLIPSAYTAGYEDLQAAGSFTLKGTVDGPFNSEKEVYPAFTLNTVVTSGSVQYPGRPVGVKDINATIDVNSPSADLNQMVVDISRFDFDLGGDPFRGRLKLASLLTDPRVDARVKGSIDLDKWAQAVPLDGVRELGGKIIADITLDRVRQSLLTAGRYQDLQVQGEASLADFVYVADELPPVRIVNATASFTPQAVVIPGVKMTLGRSDLEGGGRINTPLAYFTKDQTMRGEFKLTSRFFDADEWMTETEAERPTLSPAELSNAGAANAPTATAVFDRFDFDVEADIGELKYATYRPTGLKAMGNVKPNRMEISSAAATLGGSSFTADGTITDLFDYTFNDGVLAGNLDVRSDFIDLADFMTEEAATATNSGQAANDNSQTATAEAAVPIPANINLNVSLSADRVKYDNIDLDQMIGKLVMQGGRAILEDGSAELLGGRMKFAGAYDTSEPGDPGFRFHYDLQSLDFSRTFGTLNTFAALAPIGKFLQGKFSSDLVMEGKLGQDLFPKLGSIDAKGLFKTAEARLTGFTPVRKIGEALNVEELKSSTTFKNLITFFLVEDGQVQIEPFDFRLAGIPLRVQGRHGLEQDMDYSIRAAIPRSMIKGNLVTGAALSALDGLAGQASKLGLNISPGDTLNVDINLLGSINDPSFKFNLLGSKDGEGGTVQDAVTDRINTEVEDRKQEVEAEVTDRVNTVKEDAQRRIDSLRNVAGARAQAVRDSIARAAQAEADRLRAQAAAELRNRLRLDSLRADSLLNKVPGANAIKEELERFNPFRKKKPGGGKK